MSSSVSLMMFAEEDVEQGRKTIKDDFCYRNNVHQAGIHIRMAFLRKVYGLLLAQLAVTVLIGFVFLFTPTVRDFVQSNDWLLPSSPFLSVVIMTVLRLKRKEYPANMILLAVFTLFQAYSVGVMVSYFDQIVVLQAMILTVAVVAGLVTYTLQTKRDFDNVGSFLFASLWALIVGGVLNIFFCSTGIELVLSIAGALVFSLFIIYDTQETMKRVSPEEYILANINLYVDIISLFIHILRSLDTPRSRRHRRR